MFHLFNSVVILPWFCVNKDFNGTIISKSSILSKKDLINTFSVTGQNVEYYDNLTYLKVKYSSIENYFTSLFNLSNNSARPVRVYADLSSYTELVCTWLKNLFPLLEPSIAYNLYKISFVFCDYRTKVNPVSQFLPLINPEFNINNNSSLWKPIDYENFLQVWSNVETFELVNEEVLNTISFEYLLTLNTEFSKEKCNRVYITMMNQLIQDANIYFNKRDFINSYNLALDSETFKVETTDLVINEKIREYSQELKDLLIELIKKESDEDSPELLSLIDLFYKEDMNYLNLLLYENKKEKFDLVRNLLETTQENQNFNLFAILYFAKRVKDLSFIEMFSRTL